MGDLGCAVECVLLRFRNPDLKVPFFAVFGWFRRPSLPCLHAVIVPTKKIPSIHLRRIVYVGTISPVNETPSVLIHRRGDYNQTFPPDRSLVTRFYADCVAETTVNPPCHAMTFASSGTSSPTIPVCHSAEF